MHTRTRPAVPGDAPQMVTLINALIAAGGTTAHQTPFDDDKMRRHYIAPTAVISTHVAITNGRLSGFQNLNWPTSPDDVFPDGWAIIASFVGDGYGGQGIGRRLFSATRQSARDAGVAVIDATIRADNTGGLGYYVALGFVDYDRLADVTLTDGALVDRIRKRYDL